MANRRLYLAGPYTPYMDCNGNLHIEIENIFLAQKSAMYFITMSYDVFCPHTMLAHMEHLGSNRIMQICMNYLSICDIIALMTNWEYSNGSRDERTEAEKLGKFILYQNSDGSWPQITE